MAAPLQWCCARSWAELLRGPPAATAALHGIPPRVGIRGGAAVEPPVGGEAVEDEAELVHDGGGDPRRHDGRRGGAVGLLHGERRRVVREEPAELGLEHAEGGRQEPRVEAGGVFLLEPLELAGCNDPGF